MPQSSPDQIPAALAMGRPRKLSSEAHMAYWVWKDTDGLWHLRTSTQRVPHTFSGMLRPLPGSSFVDVNPVSPKRRDELSIVQGEIVFRFHPKNNVDGIDFRMVGPDAIELALQIDGDYDPTHIVVGQAEQQPSAAHFILAP